MRAVADQQCCSQAAHMLVLVRAVDIARIRKDGDMMVVDSVNYGELAFEKGALGFPGALVSDNTPFSRVTTRLWPRRLARQHPVHRPGRCPLPPHRKAWQPGRGSHRKSGRPHAGDAPLHAHSHPGAWRRADGGDDPASAEPQVGKCNALSIRDNAASSSGLISPQAALPGQDRHP